MSSNDLTQIRQYVRDRISISAPSLKEWKGSIEDIGNIPKTIIDNSYHITIGLISSSTKSDKHVEDQAIVNLLIFKRTFNNQVESFDELIQLANCIRLDAIDPLNIEEFKQDNDGNIEDVYNNFIQTNAIDLSNDNILKAEIEFVFKLYFGI